MKAICPISVNGNGVGNGIAVAAVVSVDAWVGACVASIVKVAVTGGAGLMRLQPRNVRDDSANKKTAAKTEMGFLDMGAAPFCGIHSAKTHIVKTWAV
jgi:hypothetical protein